jgi:glycosyltransferase involved in cell wall biosynthesis
MKESLVSVLMTVFNGELYLGLALESLIRQSYSRLEIIVVDDGSTDKTFDLLAEFARQDNRIKVIHLPNRLGPSLASNLGIKEVGGEYLARMDADDIAFLDRIGKQVAYLKEHPEAVAVGGQCFLINEESEITGEKNFPLKHEEIHEALFYFNPIAHPGCLINRRCLPADFMFYQKERLLAHDLELVFRLSQFGKLANLPDRILYYRQTPNSFSLKDPKQTFLDTLAVRQKALVDYGYRPTVKGWLLHNFQKAVLLPLPSELFYPLFKKLRLSQVQNKQAEGIAWGWRNLFTEALLRERWPQ